MLLTVGLAMFGLYRLYSRFNDDSESRPPLPVYEPVYQVPRHLGRVLVQREESLVIPLGPCRPQLDGVGDTLILFFFSSKSSQS